MARNLTPLEAIRMLEDEFDVGHGYADPTNVIATVHGVDLVTAKLKIDVYLSELDQDIDPNSVSMEFSLPKDDKMFVTITVKTGGAA